VTLYDSRTIIGTFLAFDKHLNLVLADTEEFRLLRSKAAIVEEREEKRSLGLIILRGENVVSIAVEGPPPPEKRARLAPGGPGLAKGAGRGVVQPHQGAPMGLGVGPVHGVGGPGMHVMQGRGVPMMPQGAGMHPPGMGRGGPPPY